MWLIIMQPRQISIASWTHAKTMPSLYMWNDYNLGKCDGNAIHSHEDQKLPTPARVVVETYPAPWKYTTQWVDRKRKGGSAFEHPYILNFFYQWGQTIISMSSQHRIHHGCWYQKQWESYKMNEQSIFQAQVEEDQDLWRDFAEAPEYQITQLRINIWNAIQAVARRHWLAFYVKIEERSTIFLIDSFSLTMTQNKVKQFETNSASLWNYEKEKIYILTGKRVHLLINSTS